MARKHKKPFKIGSMCTVSWLECQNATLYPFHPPNRTFLGKSAEELGPPQARAGQFLLKMAFFHDWLNKKDGEGPSLA